MCKRKTRWSVMAVLIMWEFRSFFSLLYFTVFFPLSLVGSYQCVILCKQYYVSCYIHDSINLSEVFSLFLVDINSFSFKFFVMDFNLAFEDTNVPKNVDRFFSILTTSRRNNFWSLKIGSIIYFYHLEIFSVNAAAAAVALFAHYSVVSIFFLFNSLIEFSLVFCKIYYCSPYNIINLNERSIFDWNELFP